MCQYVGLWVHRTAWEVQDDGHCEQGLSLGSRIEAGVGCSLLSCIALNVAMST